MSRKTQRKVLCAGVFSTALILAGCASPGPPRAPSLQLPALVTDLTATRRGTDVALQFTLPQRATDGLPLRSSMLKAVVCRAVEQGACIPLPLHEETFSRPTNGHATVAVLHDDLDSQLAAGAPRLLTYRVELRNNVDRSVGFSDAAYAAAGAAPPPVEGLAAQGSRLGIVLTWKPSGSLEDAAVGDAEVILRREDVGPKPVVAKPSRPAEKGKPPAGAGMAWLGTHTLQLETNAPSQTPTREAQQDRTLDTTAALDEPYMYSAERRRSVALGGRTLEVRSVESGRVAYTLHDIYPPPAPTDLAAAVFAAGPPAIGVMVDLIWQPVDDPHLAGYQVYRELLEGDAKTAKQRLNAEPVRVPAFHDNLSNAAATRHYRYSVSAVNKNGRESTAASTTVDTNRR